MPNTISDHMLANALRFSSLHSSRNSKLFEQQERKHILQDLHYSFYCKNSQARTYIMFKERGMLSLNKQT